MQRSAMLAAFVVSGAALLIAGRAQAQSVSARCAAAKMKCASGREAGLLLCHARAEGGGVAVDPACTAKVEAKFSDPMTAKGCMEEAQARPPCATTGDAGTLAATVDDFVDSVVAAVDPQFPAPVLDRCGAGKKKCVANTVKQLLACYQKAVARGEAVDASCLQKARDKLDGGSEPARGCFAKLEAKYPLSGPTPCQTFGDAGSAEARADQFAKDVRNALNPPTILDFTLSAGGSSCGATRDGSSTLLESLLCGGLDVGDGSSTYPEVPTPAGSTSRFTLGCTGDSCTASATSTPPAADSVDPDCTDVGCNFGTPLPVPNPALISYSLCTMRTWSAPASGTLDLAAGSSTMNVSLASDVYLTGNLLQPCPRCSASGSPSSPGMGTCDRGPRAGQACATTNPDGLTRDCPTGGVGPGLPCTPGNYCVDGVHVGVVPLDLSPLTTGTVQKTSATGLFCPGQTQPGCFGNAGCRDITLVGSPAGPLDPGVPASVALVSVFCQGGTGIPIVDLAAGLPAPGAESLPGSFTVR